MKTQKQRRAALDRNMKAAKEKYREDFVTDNGYIFCEGCGVNQSAGYIDVSHSVGLGQTTEHAANPKNFALMCRSKCHPRVEARDLDGLKNEEKLRAFIEKHDRKSLEKKALKVELKSLRKDAA